MAVPLIRSSSDIRRDYNAIETLAKQSGQPVYLTKNGRASLVVIDAETFDYDNYLATELAQADLHNALAQKSHTGEEIKAELHRRAVERGDL